MDHSFEEIRGAVLDILAGREKVAYQPDQYAHLLAGVAEVFERRDGRPHAQQHYVMVRYDHELSEMDRDRFLEIFWGLFREGVITLGINDSNRQFPFFRMTEFGRRFAENQQAYFFHDVESYERIVKAEIPSIDDVTVLYLKEAMQAFRAGCLLSATVMLGVATEHAFLSLVERIVQNPVHATTFSNVADQKTILHKVNKFKNILDQEVRSLPSEVKEDIDTHFVGILSVIRNFRNQAGHPTGKLLDREQVYVLLQLFVSYAKKMYQLRDHYGRMVPVVKV